jgi:hypothetical protein
MRKYLLLISFVWISMLQGFYDAADCIYFKLEGVSQAGPVKPNDPLFAISGSQTWG